MASMRSYARSKCTISQSRLQELMKEHIGDPTDDWMEVTDHCCTLKLYTCPGDSQTQFSGCIPECRQLVEAWKA